MLLTYPRLKARRLFCEFSRVIGMGSQLNLPAQPDVIPFKLVNNNAIGTSTNAIGTSSAPR